MAMEIERQDERTFLVWAPIENVVPNPLNPRRNDGVKHEDIAGIIKSRGWEIPVSAYKKGSVYVLLAGHRRLFAAKKAGMREIPVYVTPAPEDQQEELLRIGSLQRGQIDWTAYEWARFAYDRWVVWGRPSALRTFSKEQLGIKGATGEEYILVMDYFKDEVTRAKLANGSLMFSNMAHLLRWVKRFQRHMPNLLERMTEKLVVQTMISKIERGKAVNQDFRNDKLFEQATELQIQTFLTDNEMSLKELKEIVGIEDKEALKTFQGKLVSLGMLRERMATTEPENKYEWDKLDTMLTAIKLEAELKLAHLQAIKRDVI